MSIPKKIFFTYSNISTLHEDFKKNIQSIGDANTDWSLELFDFNSSKLFLTKFFGEFYADLYESINPKLPPARSDFFRYLKIYADGGVYLDIKSTLNKPLNSITQNCNKLTTSKWGGDFTGWGKQFELGAERAYQQWFLISSKKSTIVESLIRRVILNLIFYEPGIHGIGKYGVLRTTGPIIFSQVLLGSKSSEFDTFQSDEVGLVYSIYGKNFSEHTKKFQKHYKHVLLPIINLERQEYLREKYKSEIKNLIQLEKKQNNFNNFSYYGPQTKPYNFNLKSLYYAWVNDPTNIRVIKMLIYQLETLKHSDELLQKMKKVLFLLEPFLLNKD